MSVVIGLGSSISEFTDLGVYQALHLFDVIYCKCCCITIYRAFPEHKGYTSSPAPICHPCIFLISSMFMLLLMR
jgi:hypothetical protein